MTTISRAGLVRLEHTRRMRATHGYVPTPGTVCPRHVAGKRCAAGLTTDALCVCQVHHRVLDHGHLWRDEQDRLVLTAEPYGADVSDLAALQADLEPLSLRVRVAAGSQWYPGATVLVVVDAA